jgi:hypothetical protein
MPGTPHYDVVLEVPELSVEELELKVTGVLARLALDANAANLVAISAGAVVGIERVELGLYGVQAEAYLYADLDNVSHIVRRVVKTLDKNPQVLTRLLATADSLVRTVGNVANTALQPGGVVSQTVGVAGNTLTNLTQPNGLLSETTNQLAQAVPGAVGAVGQTLGNIGKVTGVLSQLTNPAGQLVQQVVTETGSLVERTLDTSGKALNLRSLGSVLDLPLVRQAPTTPASPSVWCATRSAISSRRRSRSRAA